MKYQLSLFALVVALYSSLALAAEPKTQKVTLQDGSSFEISVPEGWSFTKLQPDPTLPPTFHMKAKNGEAGLQVTFFPDKDGMFAKKEQIETAVRQVATEYVGSSVEKVIKPQDLGSKNGIGVYCEFTDAELVGKPTQPDQYKVVGTGLVSFGKTAAAFTLLGPSFTDQGYVAGKNILKTGIAVVK